MGWDEACCPEEVLVGGLYLHVPYCARKCAYCDFLSHPAKAQDPALDDYVEERVRELRRARELGLLEGCVTAYVGGGTPTLLGERLKRLIACIRDVCPEVRELTFEANPDSLSDQVLEGAHEAGATRVSIGVQSMSDTELSALGRLHTAEQAKDRVASAVASGLAVSVDLMCAVPQQTDESWEETLREACALGVGHVSVYPLTIEEGTPLGRLFEGRPTPFNDEDVQASRMERAEEVLSAAGLVRYEVASYARAGQQCAHNRGYWTGVPYLGLGMGAASMLGPQAYGRAQRLFPWLPERPVGAVRMRFTTHEREVEFMSARMAWAEDLMLGMRLTEGLPGLALDAAPEVRDDLIARGLIEAREGRLVPTHEGWLLGNELFGALWDLA